MYLCIYVQVRVGLLERKALDQRDALDDAKERLRELEEGERKVKSYKAAMQRKVMDTYIDGAPGSVNAGMINGTPRLTCYLSIYVCMYVCMYVCYVYRISYSMLPRRRSWLMLKN